MQKTGIAILLGDHLKCKILDFEDTLTYFYCQMRNANPCLKVA